MIVLYFAGAVLMGLTIGLTAVAVAWLLAQARVKLSQIKARRL
jgi:hypothetical protein